MVKLKVSLTNPCSRCPVFPIWALLLVELFVNMTFPFWCGSPDPVVQSRSLDVSEDARLETGSAGFEIFNPGVGIIQLPPFGKPRGLLWFPLNRDPSEPKGICAATAGKLVPKPIAGPPLWTCEKGVEVLTMLKAPP